MNRKTLTAVAAFAILGLAAFFALHQPEKGEGAKERARPLAPIDPKALDTIVITKGGATTTLVKEGAAYKVTAPVNYKADDALAKRAFDEVGALQLGAIVTENKAKQAEDDVDDAKGIHLVAKADKGTRVLADVIVGKASQAGSMVRLPGQDQIWLAGAGLKPAVEHSLDDWRDKTITSFPADDAEMITVKTKEGGGAVLKKTKTKVENADKWELVSSIPKVDRYDATVPGAMVQALADWKTNSFSDAGPAETGLDAPRLTVTVALKNGKNVSVLFGNPKGAEDVYVKSADTPQVFLVKKYNAERVAKRPLDFNDKQLADVGEADLAEVAVTHGADSYTLVHKGTTWTATKPPKLELDPGRTPSIGGAFKDWKAASFADDPSPAATGLAKPQAVITIKTQKKDSTTFKVGDETKDKQNVYLASSKSPHVYVVPKWSTDRLLIKLADLKKK
jgi:hypothetical protein